MRSTSVLETQDKSYFADELEKMTHISREIWGMLGLWDLRKIYSKLLDRKMV